jgi:transcriptional regulator with XRE-family HTH domain
MTPQEFKGIRLKLGLTVEMLAKRLGYTVKHIKNMERGYRAISEKTEDKLSILKIQNRVPIKRPVKPPNQGGRPKWQVDLDEPYHMEKHVVRWK